MSSQIIPGDENTDYDVYSSVLHTVILTIKAIVLGLLQITQPKAEILDPTLLCYLPFSFIYFVLFVYEAKLRRNQSRIHHFIGSVSHFFGAIAANILVSLISLVFSFVVGLMCLLWSIFVAYSFYTNPVFSLPQANETETETETATETVNELDDQISPV